MESVKRLVDRVLEVITIILFLVMVGVTTWQVISRYVLNAPSSMTEEFVKFSLIWLSMLSAAYVVGKKSHIAITLLSGKLVDSKKLILDIIIQAGFTAFGAIVMVYGGFKAVSITIDQISPSLQISMGLVYLSLPVAGILMIFYSLINILELVKEKKAGLEA
ncbi:MAG TPA: TRAP transporter small permease [Pseudogracilibacillus sp.]|nr:TRAP transporter small permease [Pseudogracilibacillus sp.]